MRVYGNNEPYRWGHLFVEAAARHGIEGHVFNKPEEVLDEPETYVFLHLNHMPARREQDKWLARQISSKRNVTLIPTNRECQMYDDKLAYHTLCGKWGPKTRHITSHQEAINLVDSLHFPMISKSREGAASSNVRILKDLQAAKSEAEAAFDQGIPEYSGNRQKGYLLWQDFCPNNSHDWRVIFIAKKYCFILKRYNRPDVPFASGSGKLEAVSELDEELINLLDYTRLFVNEYNFTFVGVDIVYDQDKKPVILEMTTGWAREGYKGCRIFEYDNGNYKATDLDGMEGFLDALMLGILNKEI